MEEGRGGLGGGMELLTVRDATVIFPPSYLADTESG
jgi:hypothetical protein